MVGARQPAVVSTASLRVIASEAKQSRRALSPWGLLVSILAPGHNIRTTPYKRKRWAFLQRLLTLKSSVISYCEALQECSREAMMSKK